MMDRLPQELLVEIFQHLSVTDLINLTKIDGRFKEIIKYTPRLWNFNLKFDKKGKIESERTKLLGQLTVYHFNPRTHQPALMICGTNISRITFVGTVVTFPFAGTEVKTPDIALIMRLCPNVQHLKFENIVVWPEVIKHMPHNNDIHVELIESSACILDLFIKCKVTALWITSKEGEYGTGIRGFLRTQPSLKTIHCQGKKVLDLFYAMGNSYGENYEELPFQLKILSLRDVFFKPYYLDMITPSASTLTYLTLVDVDPLWHHHLIADFMSKCINLEELSVTNFYFLRFRPPLSITRLTICGHVSTVHWISELVNLKTLIVKNQVPTINIHDPHYDFSNNIALESVSIISSAIKNGLDMPHIKYLKLRDIKELPDDPRDLFRNLAKVEDIVVEGCGCLTERIVREIARRIRSLKSLTVCGGKLTTDTVNFVKNMNSKTMKLDLKRTKVD